MAKNNQMGAENTSKGDCKEEKKPGKMKEILGKITRPLVEGITVAASVAVLSAPGCALDLDGKGKFRTDADAQEEQVEDAEVDVPEEIEDIIDVEGEDVSIEDTIEDPREEDSVGEDPVEEDPMEEDPAVEDVGEEDSPIDVVDADEVELPECDPIDESRLLILTTGSADAVGNIIVKYNGLNTSGEGDYDILCGDSVVRTSISIAEGSTETVNVSEHGFEVTLRVDSARAHATTVYVTVDAL